MSTGLSQLPSNLVRRQFTLYLRLVDPDDGDAVTADIGQYQGDFMLNTIPRGMCTIAVGRQANDVSKFASVHSPIASGGVTVDKLLRAYVYFNASGKHNPSTSNGDIRNADDTLLFEGFLTGLGYKKQAGNVVLTANLIHWLYDLSASSTLSALSHPQNPSQGTFFAIHQPSLTGAVQGNFLGQTLGTDYFRLGNIQADLWGEALKPYLVNLASFSHFRLAGDLLSSCAVPIDEQINTDAIKALSRIEGVSTMPNLLPQIAAANLPLSTYNLPLTLLSFPNNALTSVLGTVSDSISQSIGRITQDSWAQSTFWGKIVHEFAVEFLFSLVPQVERAMVVPFQPGLQQTYATIQADEYDYLDLAAFIPRPLRAIALFAGPQAMASRSYGSNMTEATSRVGVGGCYSPEGAKGVILIKTAPTWLAAVSPLGGKGGRTSGIRNQQATGSSTTPGQATTSDGSPEGSQIVIDADQLFQEYAHSLYVTEALRGRRGMLAGTVRFDLGPGSTVRLQGSQDRFLGDKDQFAQDLVCTVTGVSMGFDAQRPSAGTSFQLADFRNLDENESPRMSVAVHPLYGQAFRGCPLSQPLANLDF